MAYIGRQVTVGNYLKLDDISSQFNGTQTRFNLTTGGQPFYAGSSYALRVALGGVLQEPEAAYTIDNNQIVFATAPASTAEFYCIVLGTSIGIGVPAEGTVKGSKLTSPFNYGDGLFYLDDTNNRVGINTETPQADLHVVGDARITGILSIGQGTVTINGDTNTVTATTFVGDGSNLTGISGLGTALSSTTTSPLSKIFYVNNTLSVNETITVDVPDTATLSPGGFRIAYTNYADIIVEDTYDLIISDGDELVLDVLSLS